MGGEVSRGGPVPLHSQAGELAEWERQHELLEKGERERRAHDVVKARRRRWRFWGRGKR